MAKRLLTECPYCHRKVSFIGANILKTKGEHNCRGCKCISNVIIHRSLYGIAGAAVIASLITLLLNLGYGDPTDPWCILYVALPFLIFYLVVPFFVRLEPCNDKSAVNRLHRKIDPLPIQKVKKPEKPIELNVGEDFSASFMKAKTNIKPKDEDNEDKYNRIISENQEEMDITSGIDIDISGIVKSPDSEEDLNLVIPDEENVYDDSPVSSGEKISLEKDPDNGGEVSFVFGKNNSSDE